MTQKAKDIILEFLTENDPELLKETPGANLDQLAELIVDKANSLNVENVLLEHAYATGIDYDRFEDFFDEMIDHFEKLGEGDETPEDLIESVAKKYI